MDSKKSFASSAKKFLEPLWRDKPLFYRTMFEYTVRGLTSVYSLIFIKHIISTIENGTKTGFTSWIIGYCIAILCYYLIRYISRKRGWTEGKFMFRDYITQKYLKYYIRLNNNYIEGLGTGKLLSLIDGGIKDRANLLEQTIQYSMSLIVALLMTIYFLLQWGRIYLLLFVGIAVLIYIVVIELNKLTTKERRNQIDELHNYNSILTKIIMSKFEILHNDRIDYENSKLEESMTKVVASNKRRATIAFGMFEIPTFMMNVLRVVVIAVVGYGVLNHAEGYSYALLTALLVLLGIVYSVLDESVTFFKDFTKSFSSVEKLWSVFDDAPMILGYDNGKEFVFDNGNIVFENVTFTYTKNELLNNFSLTLHGGKKTALVGISGSGKSTIMKLIAGYIHPISGDIYVDNHKLPTEDTLGEDESISLKSYYKHIGYLTQEPSVFDGTIYENLVYALDYSPSKMQLDQAIQQAQCQFIYEMPNQLETQIGEKGIRLSGGQRQRLAIAKIFLKDPKIILLDEPTSALDSLSEEAITKALEILFHNRTVVIIAHRLQTVKKADDIIVLDAGKIEERGTHAELVAKGGQYAKMLELQSGF